MIILWVLHYLIKLQERIFLLKDKAHVIQKKVWVAKPESEDKTIVPNPILYGDSNSGEYKMVSVEEITWIPLENGSPYNGSLYAKKIDDSNLNLPDGIEGVYATLTVALADLNLRGVSADVNFLLTDTLYSAGESFPLIANIINENLPSSTKKITIKPSTGVTSKISGSSTSGIFVSYGVDYVNLEGSNSGGTDRSLTIENITQQPIHMLLVFLITVLKEHRITLLIIVLLKQEELQIIPGVSF